MKSKHAFKTIIALTAFAFSSAAMAHFELGEYRGTAADGTACSFTVKGVSFEGNLRHPLNERIEIVFNGVSYALSHPPVVDDTAGTVRFDHDHARAIRGVATGAEALTVTMDHSEGRDGPGSFVFVSDNYKSPAMSSKLTCTGLVH